MSFPRHRRIKILYGRVLDRCAHRLAGGRLGVPRTSIRTVQGGHTATFQHGVVRWDRSKDRVRVRYR